jgi:hypothetical protein
MDYLITESQLRIILEEQDKSSITNKVKELDSYTKNLVSKFQNAYGINLNFLLTWGSSVAGLVMPLDNFIRSGNFELTDDQITLILIGVAFTHLNGDINTFKKILNKIKDDGLEEVFKEVLFKSRNLKDSFYNVLKSANVTLKSTFDILSYSFLIPIIGDIQSLTDGGDDLQTIAMRISKRLVASGLVVVGQIALTEVIKKLLKRFEQTFQV